MNRTKKQPHLDTWKIIVLMLREVALNKGITHQDIADNTGLQRSNVSRIFSLRYCPGLDIALKLAGALGLNMFFEDMDGTTDLSVAFENAMEQIGRRPDKLPQN